MADIRKPISADMEGGCLKIDSTALEANIRNYTVKVSVDPQYIPLQEVMSRYSGLMSGLNNFLEELSHPYKNWEFIVSEARRYALDYFHLVKTHSKGPEAIGIYVDIFSLAIEQTKTPDIRTEAVDNFLLFLEKIMNDSGNEFEKFVPVLNTAFQKIVEFQHSYFLLFVKSFYQLDRIAQIFLTKVDNLSADFMAINQLLLRYYQETYTYWLREDDPQSWLQKEADDLSLPEEYVSIFEQISHAQISKAKAELNSISKIHPFGTRSVLSRMLELPGYKNFVDIYREVPRKLLRAGTEEAQGKQWKLFFLFHIMNTAGLSIIHEDALKDINRTLKWLIVNEKPWNLRKLIKKTFSILKNRTTRFPATALNCVLNMGKGVSKTGDRDLVTFFISSVIDLGFQSPMIGGVDNDWQIKVNSAHIKNLRTWLELIELNPVWSIRLISALIIHLSLCGVFIKDTDLFPRDITRFLNSNIAPVYNLCKQLARLFPSYFNDIGAEGHLRDISTRLDEICHRKDPLVYFIRKQSHVESSNRIISLIEATIKFWETREKEQLEPFVPPDIYRRIQCRGLFIDGLHKIFNNLKNFGLFLPDDLLTEDDQKLEALITCTSGVSDDDLKRVQLAISLYRMLYQKYHTGFTELNTYVSQLPSAMFPKLGRLKRALEEPDAKSKLRRLLEYLQVLKDLILSNKTYESREDIYKKRHFTIDIPSMYGRYYELKFDALGLTFRIESLVNVLFEDIVENIDLTLITKATFYQIYARLRLFSMALKIDGIASAEFERQLDFLASSLEVRGFTLTQYLDIFRGFARAVQNIINDYFTNVYDRNLSKILSSIPRDQILTRFLPLEEMNDPEKIKHRISEIFFRERIALSLGLQQLDIFLSRILNTLYKQSTRLDKEKLHLLLLYDPKSALIHLDDENVGVSGIIQLGAKGFSMVMLKELSLPVPPAFIITTEVFRVRKILDTYPPAKKIFRQQVVRQISYIEKITGKCFGNPKNPLLFSVRSGSSISQPGMMDTFLDVGINEQITEGLAAVTGKAWFAWDNYRRFLQCYGMSFGLARDHFDAIISHYKKKWKIPLKRQFSGEQMKCIALSYRKTIIDAGIELIEEPLDQLLLTINRVFDSWESPKAKTYRKIMGISDDWGTAVTVQAMVYGNISEDSGTGVFFTHNPRWSGESVRLWGDFTLGNQGEDVVSGLVKTLPISIQQQSVEMRNTDVTLESHFSEIYEALKRWAIEMIYTQGWSPQEIEFTFEGPSAEHLYVLQTRDMAIRGRKDVLRFDLDKNINNIKLLGHGIGVSGGAMCGRMVFNLDEIEKWRQAEPETSLIIARGDTVPDDIREIYAADGLLTARGGLTSHAAVVAHRLGKVCVVGCGNMVCNEQKREVYFNQIRLRSGEYISIDGREGSVHRGHLKIKSV
jgi:pyruvate,orthophosphate dikinase